VKHPGVKKDLLLEEKEGINQVDQAGGTHSKKKKQLESKE